MSMHVKLVLNDGVDSSRIVPMNGYGYSDYSEWSESGIKVSDDRVLRLHKRAGESELYASFTLNEGNEHLPKWIPQELFSQAVLTHTFRCAKPRLAGHYRYLDAPHLQCLTGYMENTGPDLKELNLVKIDGSFVHGINNLIDHKLQIEGPAFGLCMLMYKAIRSGDLLPAENFDADLRTAR